ncbi:MAG TPA: hypothetical protein DDX04_14375 [Massilia sp.]|nr:hypothetical protein [Massilia sp.]
MASLQYRSTEDAQARAQVIMTITTTTMKNIAFSVSLALATFAAQAQTGEQAPLPAPAVQYEPVGAKPLRFVLGIGATFGGDKLATAYYDDGDEIDLRAGESIALVAGADYRINQDFSVQGTIAYHVDRAGARNGDMRFERIPFELLGYYHVNDKVRVGGGLRYVTGVEFRSSGAGDIGDYKFKDTTSAVAEIEYLFNPRMGLKLRYANDEFKEKSYGGKVKGEHVGIFANFYL